ncbi:hypothetical protein [Petrimonas sp.]|uniref:hypothetical protein n=1 Tax=Petrimonas sp. TaxID=2023866 RepID=UPI003F5195C9
MKYTEIGWYAVTQIEKTAKIREDEAEIPVFVVMPNHIHLIVFIDEPRRDASNASPITASNASPITASNASPITASNASQITASNASQTAASRASHSPNAPCASHENTKTDASDDGDVFDNRDAFDASLRRRGDDGNKFGPQKRNLASVVRGIKSAVKSYANQNNIPFAWQSRYHDRIIRDRHEMNRIAEYIENNVINWAMDKYNTPP